MDDVDGWMHVALCVEPPRDLTMGPGSANAAGCGTARVGLTSD